MCDIPTVIHKYTQNVSNLSLRVIILSKVDELKSIKKILTGRVLFEFNTHVANATIIMHEVQKRFPIKLMLVSGEKHKNVVKVWVHKPSIFVIFFIIF